LKKILVVFGTRPEAIKMVPVVKALQLCGKVEVKLCVTAQHRQMLDRVLALFGIEPDFDLDIMQPDQDLYDISSRILLKMKMVLQEYMPDLVLVHGDTTTTSITALAAFYQKISVGHVEAGLRTGDIYSPWPEEGNRRMVAVLATYHFAPTLQAKKNLLKSGIAEEKIVVIGNTVIDTLFMTLRHIEEESRLREEIVAKIKAAYPVFGKRQFILVTGHRRENFGEGFIHICEAIRTLALSNPSIDIVYPVHLNPHVQGPVKQMLSDIENIYLSDPLDYEVFIYLMYHAYLILTDSGGIQEEAPSLGKPVLLMRHETERPEAVEIGTVRLVGTDTERIVRETQRVLDDPQQYLLMSQAHNPYGDGKASERIAAFIEAHL